MLSQERIYNERYQRPDYDNRSAVRVLTAESTALHIAASRAMDSVPTVPVTLLDFGYGTGRVTNEFLLDYGPRFASQRRDLTVVAYDVSAVGLRKAAEELAGHGFRGVERLSWPAAGHTGHIVGSMKRDSHGRAVTVTFVHGSEADHPKHMRDLLLEANGHHEYLMVTSWYSGLGHIPGRERRREFFGALGSLTHPYGELLVAVAATGDLVTEQSDWAAWRAGGRVGDLPIECDGDVMYFTELGQLNYWHVFSTDLDEMLGDVRTDRRQKTWVEGVRLPSEEFDTSAAECENYRQVRAFNRKMHGAPWTADDYRQMHTVAAIRSANANPVPECGYAGGYDVPEAD